MQRQQHNPFSIERLISAVLEVGDDAGPPRGTPSSQAQLSHTPPSGGGEAGANVGAGNSSGDDSGGNSGKPSTSSKGDDSTTDGKPMDDAGTEKQGSTGNQTSLEERSKRWEASLIKMAAKKEEQDSEKRQRLRDAGLSELSDDDGETKQPSQD
ncbi:uncharacterized protein IUM83_08421 [Phytophthora cinnamomi]|uniref:uncharacterized protein n=1 Tax=Phytophthora cinnamomi TaxID=4785 RepID=UPI0035597B36|nr:hypothetical protein IUM83_08421 [Phytophthora cinnamomi]